MTKDEDLTACKVIVKRQLEVMEALLKSLKEMNHIGDLKLNSLHETEAGLVDTIGEVEALIDGE